MHKLKWCEPLEFAKRYAGYKEMVFLHSSLSQSKHSNLSILAIDIEEIIIGNWKNIEDKLTEKKQSDWQDKWFGFMSYELGHPSKIKQSTITLPELWFGRFKSVFIFNHQNKTLQLYGKEPAEKPIKENSEIPNIDKLNSNMSKEEYLKIIDNTLEQIASGEFYQANITRKFYGNFKKAPTNTFSIFRNLCKTSPAPYSAYLRVNGTDIISSSPECFLTIGNNGNIESRPIKGTAPISSSPIELAESNKDRAENLMIVDLMRNDLSKNCKFGSVKTTKLFEVTSYSTLHHMESTITGKLNSSSNIIKVIKDCFPPGSMTGAPKKAVMNWCEHSEKIQRGIYSGAIGWIGEDFTSDLSVVIRTLLIKGRKFEFQVGGGIVADSEPEKEWQETLTKSKAISGCLNIDIIDLSNI